MNHHFRIRRAPFPYCLLWQRHTARDNYMTTANTRRKNRTGHIPEPTCGRAAKSASYRVLPTVPPTPLGSLRPAPAKACHEKQPFAVRTAVPPPWKPPSPTCVQTRHRALLASWSEDAHIKQLTTDMSKGLERGGVYFHGRALGRSYCGATGV